jgi:hypothetical protein
MYPQIDLNGHLAALLIGDELDSAHGFIVAQTGDESTGTGRVASAAWRAPKMVLYGMSPGLRGVSACRLLALLVCATTAALGGPPFQTDDPEPIEFKHYECYTFAASDGTPIETDTVGPAVEFNWGALPNVHLHVVIPAAAIFPAAGPRAFGLGDIELGIKYRFVQETRHRPMIGTFPMFEMATGSAARGLGVGRTWYKLPVWVQKSFGPWTTYGGGGVTVVSAPGYRNQPFAGWLVQRDLSKKVTLGTEVFYHGPEGPGTAQTRPATLIDIGGYYKFRDPGFQLLLCYGHTAIGQTENYAYLGLYWTWGKSDKSGDTMGAALRGVALPGIRAHD